MLRFVYRFCCLLCCFCWFVGNLLFCIGCWVLVFCFWLYGLGWILLLFGFDFLGVCIVFTFVVLVFGWWALCFVWFGTRLRLGCYGMVCGLIVVAVSFGFYGFAIVVLLIDFVWFCIICDLLVWGFGLFVITLWLCFSYWFAFVALLFVFCAVWVGLLGFVMWFGVLRFGRVLVLVCVDFGLLLVDCIVWCAW